MDQKTTKKATGSKQTTKKSRTGTKNTVVEGLKIKELCDLVEVCALSGVKELKLGTIYITFGQLAEHNRTFVGTRSSRTSGETSMEDETDYEASYLEEIAGEEAQMAQILIDDPVAFEEEIMDEMVKGVSNERNESGRVEPALQRQ